tara:strand:+ start:2309 stop:3493 length:1185 start_codon:yes stop_codon:yes gene_type:complete
VNRTIYTLIGLQLLDAIGLGLLLPILPFYIQDYGASAIEVTQLVAVYALASMVFSPIVGRLSDRLGRKAVVLIALAGAAAAYLGMLFANTLWLIFTLRALTGAMAAKTGVLTAWIIDHADEEQRARWLGIFASMNGIGMLLGPLFAGVLFHINLLGLTGYESVFAGVVVLCILGFLSIAWLPDGPTVMSEAPGQESRASKRTGPYADLLVLNFAIFFAFSVIFSTSAIYVDSRFGWGPSAAGFAIGTMTGCVALARAFASQRILRKLGTRRGTLITGLIMCVSLVAAASTSQPPIFMLLYCLSASAYAVAAIGVTLLLAQRLDPASRGAGMGMLGAASSGAIVAGASINGYLFELLSPSAPFQIVGALVGALLMIWYVYTRNAIANERSASEQA